EKTLPEVIALVTRIVPLNSTTLVVDVRGTAAATCWPSAGASAEAQRIAQAHAEASFRYFIEPGPEAPASGAFPHSDDGPGAYVALPLAVAHEGVFGVLQFEGAVLDEANLAFVNAV